MHQPETLPAVVSPALQAPDLSDFLLGEWKVEPGLNRLTRHGNALHVRPQLMDVLVCLAGAPGRTVHRDELMRRVWPGQSAVSESAVARCIAELRQALGDQAASPTHIETVHKRGYRVIAPVVAGTGVTSPEPARPAARRAATPERPSLPRLRWIDRVRLLAHQLAGALTIR